MKSFFEDQGIKFFILSVKEVVSAELRKGTAKKVIEGKYIEGLHNYIIHHNYHVTIKVWIENFERIIILTRQEYEKFVE